MFKFLVYLKFCGKMLICVFNESTGNPKESYLALVVFHELCSEKCLKLMAINDPSSKNQNEYRYIQK